MIPLPISTYIWPQVTPNRAKKKYLFGHLIEWLLYQEVPNVFAALMVSYTGCPGFGCQVNATELNSLNQIETL